MNQDSVYDHSKNRSIVSDEPDAALLRYDYMGPFANTQEAKLARAIKSVTMPAALIPDIVRPFLPQVQLFPPRFGYRTRELDIMDVMNVNSEFQPERVDFSREPGGYSGTSRNVSESIW
jgi:hypothetical protein